MDEIREKITSAIRIKEEKRLKRKKKYRNYELCFCIDEGGLFNTKFDFDFVINKKLLESTGFSRLFIITTNNFFVIERNGITSYEKKLK